MCEALLGDLPDQGTMDQQALQFDWLPTTLAEARYTVNEAVSSSTAELEKLLPSIEAREVAKVPPSTPYVPYRACIKAFFLHAASPTSYPTMCADDALRSHVLHGKPLARTVAQCRAATR